ADGQRPPAHRAAQLPAADAARQPDRLLRRRDRHGRQRVPRRSQRRADAHAVVRRPQRRLFVGRPRGAVSSGDYEPHVSLPGSERGRAGKGPGLHAQHDAPADRGAEALAGVGSRHDRVPPPTQPGDPRLSQSVARRHVAGRRQPVGAHSARRARSDRARGRGAHRDAQRQPVSARDARAIFLEPRPARLLLVPPRTPRAPPRALRHRGNRDMSDIEGRPGSPGAPRASAGESEGALAPSLKNLGGHFEAPHLENWLRAQRRLDGEQSNTSVIFGDRLIMKVFRRLADGLNPDLEITRFLTQQTTFRGTPRLAGAVEYSTGARGTFERFADVGGVATLAVLQEYVGGARDGWRWLLDRLAAGDAALDGLRRLGTRTAELHAALATPTPDP